MPHARSLRPVAALALVLAVTLTACGGSADDGLTPVGSGDFPLLPRCVDLEPVTAAPEDYRDTPVYVANEMPVEEVVDLVGGMDGYEDVWIDRDHNGWVTVAASDSAEAIRDAIASALPDAGVVVVDVDWTTAQLDALQADVLDRAGDLGVQASGRSVQTGHVAVTVPFLTDEVHAALSAEFVDEPVCVEGGDPVDQPAPGPQPSEGDGWRLLAAVQRRDGHEPALATTAEQVRELTGAVGLEIAEAEIDLEREVLVRFGQPHGSSCDDFRLDDVTFDGGTVAPVIVDLSGQVACTDDLAGVWVYVVALERAALPAPPFTVTSVGMPADLVLRVDVDLRVPGEATVVGVVVPEDDPRATAVRDGGVVEPGVPADYALFVHCGAEVLGMLNDVFWVAADPEAAGVAGGATPDAWRALVDAQQEVIVEVVLETGDPPTVTATAEGHSVVYVPGSIDGYGCD